MMTRVVAACLLSFVALSLSSHAEANEDAVSETKEALEMWAPTSVKQMPGGVLQVLLPQRRVTDQIYTASMLFGLCQWVQHFDVQLTGIEQIEILNQFGRQGYVFEGGANECRKLGELTSKGAKIHLLGKTHLK